MKSSILICILFFSLGVHAQNSGRIVNDSAKSSHTNQTVEDNGILYLVDGVISDELHIKAGEILERSVLAGKKLKYAVEHANIFFERKIDTVIVITTKQAAAAMYKNTFCSFSRKYRKYLKSCENNDRSVLYVLNGNPLESDENETIKALCRISKDSIISVKFIPHVLKRGVYDYRSDRAALIIRTKT